MIPQHPMLSGPSPVGEPPRRREGLLILVAVLLGAASVLGALVGYQRWSAARETTSASAEIDRQPPTSNATPTTLAPSPDPTPSPTEPDRNGADAERAAVETVPCPDGYDDAICRSAEFVQRTRGRPFKEFPTVELLADADFELALVEDLDGSRADLEADELLLKSLGLVPTDLDLFGVYRLFIQAGVVGFYDPETRRLVVRGGDFDLYGQLILVHELVHAYDDQWFDLGRDDFDGDAEYGFAAVIEGNASRVENLWRSQLSAEDQARLLEQEYGSLSGDDLDQLLSLPQVVLSLQLSPYQDGETYVSNLAGRGGESAVDERLAIPPQSSEQVLHPAGAADELVVVDVEPPPADGPTIGRGTIGELLLGHWLGPRAGVGWGGDGYVIWESGSNTCIAVDLVADSEADLAEMEIGAGQWVADRPDQRSAELVESVDRSLLRVSGCFG